MLSHKTQYYLRAITLPLNLLKLNLEKCLRMFNFPYKELNLKIIMRLDIFSLILSAFLFGLIIFIFGSSITGPFIFADESHYFAIARNIAESGRYYPDDQYNPLYPIIISVAFFVENIVWTYDIARIINIILFSLIVIPVYYFSRELNFGRFVSFVFGTMAICLPSGAFIHLIWAEPLQYITIATGMLFSLRYFNRRNILDGALAGLFFGLAFLTKQYGLAFAIALVFTASLWAYLANRERKRKFLGLLSILLGSTICVLPLFIRNALSRSGNVLGYQSHFDVWLQKYSDLGAFNYFHSFTETFLYQLSAISFETWGLVVPVFVGLVFAWRKLPREQVLFVVFLLMGLGALVVVSTVHMLGYNTPYLPNGRHYASVTPFIVIISIKWFQILVKDNEKKQTIFLFQPLGFLLICTAIGLLVWLCSPLKSLHHLSLVTNPEFSFLNYFINDNSWKWDMNPEVDTNWRIYVALIPAVMLLMFNYGIRWFPKIISVLIISMILFQSYEAHHFVARLGTSDLNNVIRFALDSSVEDGAEIRFDSYGNEGSSPFLAQFWFDSDTLPYYDPLAFTGQVAVNFKRLDANSMPQIELTRGQYSVVNLKPKLLDISNFSESNVQYCEGNELPESGETRQQIYGVQPITLAGVSENGLQSIVITLAPIKHCAHQKIHFDVTVQGRIIGTISADENLTVSLAKKLDVLPGKFNITLSPKTGSAWALKSIDLVIQNQDTPDLYVSKQLLPMHVAFESGNWHVYDRR